MRLLSEVSACDLGRGRATLAGIVMNYKRTNFTRWLGDPEKLTLFGQSSGGVSVDYWAYAYESDPIVHALISESGNALSFGLLEPDVQTKNWDTATKAVGCGNSSDVLGCMRSVPWEKLEAAAADVPPSTTDNPVRSTPPFYPRVDGEIVFSDYESLAKAGSFAKLVRHHNIRSVVSANSFS